MSPMKSIYVCDIPWYIDIPSVKRLPVIRFQVRSENFGSNIEQYFPLYL